ncbi:hypothetical protein ACVWXO_006852 [Bradyrhizobium sp. LM2.7]
MKTGGVANAIWVRDQLGDEDRPKVFDFCAPELLCERHPLMVRIPEDHRRKQRQGNKAAEIGPGREEPAPQLRHRREPDQDRRPEEHCGVFRQQRRTDGDADGQPPGAAAGLQHLGEKEQHEARGDKQRRVGRHDQRTDRSQQRHVEQDGAGRGDARAAEQDRGRAIDRIAHRQRQQDRHQANAELGIAGDHGAGADHVGNHRRMVVVAARQVLRPHPVVGFVERDRRERGRDEPQADQRKDHQRGIADDPRVSSAHGQLPRRAISCARRTVRTSRNSTPRPSAHRPCRPATRSAPGHRPRRRHRHWQADRRCTRCRKR